MCVPSYSVCLKGPQQKCVCCWHSPFNIVWIFHQDPKPCYKSPLFSDLFVHSLCECVSVCACRRVRVCVCREIIDIYLVWDVANFVWLYMSLYTVLCQFFLYLNNIVLCCPSWRSVVVWWGKSWAQDWTSSCRQPCTPLLQHLLCKGPWRSLECRSPQVTDKARWKGGFCVHVWKKRTRLKIACPPVNALPLKTAGPGSCLHSATYKLILPLCCYLVTTPPLLPPFVGCFVRAPSRRQSQPHKESSFWIHWPPMNTGDFLFCAVIHKSVLTHWALSVCLKRFFMNHFLLFSSHTFC